MSTEPSGIALDIQALNEALQTRNRKLAEDKAYLQLVIRLIERLNPMPGLEDMVSDMLSSIVETIGGTNIRLWFWIDTELHYADFLGERKTLDAIDDPLAAMASEQGKFVEQESDSENALLRDGVIPGAWTWAFPLLAGAERVGVIKLENLHISSAHLRNFLPIFFSHAALLIGGEIRNLLRQRAEQKLQLAASVFTHAREGIMITQLDGAIIEVNEAFTRITGYSRDEVIGRNPRLLKSGQHGEAYYAAMWRSLLENGYWYGEIWNRRKNGEFFAEMQTISAVRDAQGQIKQYVSLFSDITRIKEHERELEHIAHYDALTGLPNRVFLADRLHQAMAQSLRRNQKLAVVYLDLDGFKAVNDRFGHDAGDQLLITVSNRMKQTLREGDTLARIGGDEFVAVLLDLNEIEASLPMLARMLAAAAEPVLWGDSVLQVSASVGVTFYPQTEEADADQLMRQADQAMYQAKVSGKNRFHLFDADQDRSIRGHHESLERIRRALIEHEFVLYYQPKVNMRLGKLVGAEALIRWRHPIRGLMLPGEFLPVIEDHSLAIDLGEWVLENALGQIEQWHALGLDIPVSVNVGARQLQQSDFAERLRRILAAHPSVGPNKLELEVLETSALEDLVHVSHVIAACLEMGVSFALDDFGTGYSSLTYLKRLPVSQIKIDQSFVRDMLHDPDDLAIVESVLGLATAFRRQTIAEGVETREHGEMLLYLGCELAQGYGIARPMPASEVPAWAAVWKPFASWVDMHPVSRDDLPILFAAVEHRAWIVAIEACLQGEIAAKPQLDHQLCRFGQWLNSFTVSSQSLRPALQSIETLHRQVHVLGEQMIQLLADGRQVEARAGLAELHRLRDALLASLWTVMHRKLD